MKYLLCELNDENYTQPEFIQYESKEEAFNEALNVCGHCFEEEIIEVEDYGNRVTARCDDRFFVTEIKEFEANPGDYILIWHHAYNGVGFNILAVGTYEQCKERRIQEIKRIFDEYDLSNADNDDFDIELDTCVDTGEEWEVFSIIEVK